jgi:hypothetical protein
MLMGRFAMASDFEKMDKAKTVLTKMAEGINPITGEQIKDESFLNDPRIIRCFYFITEVLDNVMKGVYSRNSKLTQFVITPEQKSMVELSDGPIGVSEFSRQVNLCIDQTRSKKLTAVEINKRLRKIGVLGEEINSATGKARTVTNSKSKDYGFEMIKKSFNGNEYDMVVMNDTGKRYLLDHLEEIMSIDVN